MVARKEAVLLFTCTVQCGILDLQDFDFTIFVFCFIILYDFYFLWGLLKELLSCLLVTEPSLFCPLCTGGLLLSLLATDLKAKDDSVKERVAYNISPSAFYV